MAELACHDIGLISNRQVQLIGDAVIADGRTAEAPDQLFICVAYLHKRGVLGFDPSRATVFDFDERVVDSVKRFADKERVDNILERCSNRLKYCRFATRYERRAIHFTGFIFLAAAMIWLR